MRDERLTQAWRADLEACEARRRRDELATAAGVDPVRAGDRAFVTALLEVARTEEEQARAAVAEHGAPTRPRRHLSWPAPTRRSTPPRRSCGGWSSCAAPPR